MVLESAKKHRELFAWVLLGYVAANLLVDFVALFLGDGFVDNSTGLAASFVSPVAAGAVALAVLLVSAGEAPTGQARTVVGTALGLVAVALLVGLVTWVASLTADSLATGTQTALRSLTFLVAAGLLAAAGYLAYLVYAAVPARVRQQQAPTGPGYGQQQWGPPANLGYTGYDQSQYGPQYGQPPYGQQYGPQYGVPHYGPQYGQPQYGPPYGQPEYGQQYGQPEYGQPGYGEPYPQQQPPQGPPPGQYGPPAAFGAGAAAGDPAGGVDWRPAEQPPAEQGGPSYGEYVGYDQDYPASYDERQPVWEQRAEGSQPPADLSPGDESADPVVGPDPSRPWSEPEGDEPAQGGVTDESSAAEPTTRIFGVVDDTDPTAGGGDDIAGDADGAGDVDDADKDSTDVGSGSAAGPDPSEPVDGPEGEPAGDPMSDPDADAGSGSETSDEGSEQQREWWPPQSS
ncbi:MAG: hypothetical protein ACRDO1_12650 [Nocardioidaceae bacterium]